MSLFRCAGVPGLAFLSSNFMNLFLPWLQLDKAKKALESHGLLGSAAPPCICEYLLVRADVSVRTIEERENTGLLKRPAEFQVQELCSLMWVFLVRSGSIPPPPLVKNHP